MTGAPASVGRPNYGGVVVAGVAFLLTRYTVLEATRPNATLVGFLVGPGPFLALGLGMTALGLALTVSGYRPRDVRTVAWWCVAGVVASAALVGTAVVESTVAGRAAMPPPDGLTFRVLLGGTAAGVLVGFRSATNRRSRRRLADHADRLTLLNRLLRHEVLNKVNVIEGYASLGSDAVDRSRLDTIREAAGRIGAAIEEIGLLAKPGDETYERQDLRAVAEREADRLRERGVTVVVEGDDRAPAWASDGVDVALRQLLENAVEHDPGPDPTVRVTVESGDGTVRLVVAGDGPGLSGEQRSTLDRRSLPEYDDPGAGFGLTVARLLTEGAGGRLQSTDGDGDGTTLTLAFPAANGGAAPTPYGVPPPALAAVAAGSLLAGVAMGALLQALTGNLAVIGALYGVENGQVGWITHLFHSVVFGVGFAAFLRSRPGEWRTVRRAVPLAVAYGVLLWFVAAGVVMPLWLRALGLAAPLPSLALPSLLGHVVWGAVLGGAYALSRRVRTRWLEASADDPPEAATDPNPGTDA